ncbi:MAG: photosystem II reaction center protein Psb28 [Microcoleaceae cyanobacterium]
MAKIQFSRGMNETVIPDVRLTRSQDGSQGTAQFYFDKPDALAEGFAEEITGMYLIDDEGELSTFDVKAKFVNGKPEVIEAKYLMRSSEEWDRFIRFMDRYGEQNGLGFNKS